jgi:hypothetical protein
MDTKNNGLRTQTTVGPPGCGGNCFFLKHHERTELYPLLRRKRVVQYPWYVTLFCFDGCA